MSHGYATHFATIWAIWRSGSDTVAAHVALLRDGISPGDKRAKAIMSPVARYAKTQEGAA
jgi:hypothetical protein